MKVKTSVKAGGVSLNHNEKLVRDTKQSAGLKVKTSVKGGAWTGNHNEQLVRVRR